MSRESALIIGGMIACVIFILAILTTFFPIVIPLLKGFTMCHEDLPPFVVQVKVNMEVNGQPLSIKRNVECKQLKINSAGELSGWRWRQKLPSTFYVSIGALGKRLPDGSAVMMWTPYYCDHETYTDANGNERRRPVPVDFGSIPYLAWTPNADTLETLEVYPSKKYFGQPYARIKMRSVSVSEAPPGAKADPPDEFEWFTQEFVAGEKRISRPRFVSYTVRLMPENEWRGQYPKFDSLLDSFKEITIIPETDIGEHGRRADLLVYDISTKINSDNSHCANRLNQRRLWTFTKTKYRRVFLDHCPPFDLPYPVLEAGGEIQLEEKAGHGFLILKRVPVTPYSPPEKRSAPIKITLRGQTLFMENFYGRASVYDPETRDLFQLIKLTPSFNVRQQAVKALPGG